MENDLCLASTFNYIARTASDTGSGTDTALVYDTPTLCPGLSVPGVIVPQRIYRLHQSPYLTNYDTDTASLAVRGVKTQVATDYISWESRDLASVAGAVNQWSNAIAPKEIIATAVFVINGGITYHWFANSSGSPHYVADWSTLAISQ